MVVRRWKPAIQSIILPQKTREQGGFPPCPWLTWLIVDATTVSMYENDGSRAKQRATRHSAFERKQRSERQWAVSIKKSYGMTKESYEQLLVEQKEKCAICGRRESVRGFNGRTYRLTVDHDHVTGQVRGLLCHNCNQALGLFGDNARRLRRAYRYLARFYKGPT